MWAGLKKELKRIDYWVFWLYFAWISASFAFAGGAFPSILYKLAGETGNGELYAAGIVIDKYGFRSVFFMTTLVVQLSVVGMLVPSFEFQVVTMVLYAIAQAWFYSLQFGYISESHELLYAFVLT